MPSEVRKLKHLGEENARLRRSVSDLSKHQPNRLAGMLVEMDVIAITKEP
jgi:hypothetical protein